MIEPETVKFLAEAGIVGVCLALIGALVYLIRAFLKVVSNHIHENTESLDKNTNVLANLSKLIDKKL